VNASVPAPASELASPIPERSDVTAQIFNDEILPAARPVVMRGLVANWPIVAAGRQSPQAMSEYIRRFDRGNSVSTMFGPPGMGGRFFYNSDLSGFNFKQGTAKLSAVLDYLLAYANDDPPPALAAQSVPIGENLSGMQVENPMPLLPDSVDPRIWIGNRVIIAAHHDPSENIACVAAGRRRFTLFPPEQVGNLYMGPFELTPAGATISMVSFDNPNMQAFPRFADAMASALVADLEPGDAIYIPYMWWHHVRSIEQFNVLVNYWWAPPNHGRGAPRDAFFHAMLAIKELPESHRRAWRTMFDHYVFQTGGPPVEHLPPDKRGVAGLLDAAGIRALRGMLAKLLGRP
jgi:cupin-like protein